MTPANLANSVVYRPPAFVFGFALLRSTWLGWIFVFRWARCSARRFLSESAGEKAEASASCSRYGDKIACPFWADVDYPLSAMMLRLVALGPICPNVAEHWGLSAAFAETGHRGQRLVDCGWHQFIFDAPLEQPDDVSHLAVDVAPAVSSADHLLSEPL